MSRPVNPMEVTAPSGEQPDSPFHAGEQAVQQRLGVREAIEPWARRVVRNALPDEHRAFYPELPFLVVAARDDRGRPWPSLLVGRPGFAHSPDAATLAVEAAVPAGDALAGALTSGADVGLLGIELPTRRRNRVNGRLRRSDSAGFELQVAQSFGNCPQHIRPRQPRFVERPAMTPSARRATALDRDARAFVNAADTFFIASGHRGDGEHPAFGMDVSHRGGAPGFVRADGPRTITFVDYAGNNHFNTVGNLLLDPRVGLLFIDFTRGRLLQISGRASVDFEPAAVDTAAGAERVVRVTVDAVNLLEDAVPLRWGAPEAGRRSLRLVERRAQSSDVTSFVFAARDGGPLADFVAGQYLPLEVPLGDGRTLTRTYSLSGAPGEPRYRISVKREPRGEASRALHDRLEVGAIVEAGPPTGGFVLREADRDVVLAGAGIGITPLLAMLHALVARGDPREVFVFYAVRDRSRDAFGTALRALAAQADNVHLEILYSRPGATDRRGIDHDAAGRLDAGAIAARVDLQQADVYACGPPAFMAALGAGLERRGLDAAHLYGESFGPAAAVDPR